MAHWFFIASVVVEAWITSALGGIHEKAFQPPGHASFHVPITGATDCTNKTTSNKRYLVYGVNPVEGFNLRADVYVRAANLVKLLREEQNWVLVLPPWEHLYHWKSDFFQDKIPWRTFYDVASLRRYTEVMELAEFFQETGNTQVDEVIYLQDYEGGWKSGQWVEKIDEAPCLEDPGYYRDENGTYGGFFGYYEFSARLMRCLSVQGTADILAPELLHGTRAQ